MAGQRAPQVDGLRREDVRTPDEVAAMLRLRALGWGTRRIAAEFGCSRNTVKRYVGLGGWAPLRVARRPRALDGLEGWLAERFRRHRGNADVVRQELPGRARHRRQPAHRRARGRPPPARAGRRGPRDGALRDPAGPPDADRLRRGERGDRGRGGTGLPVRRHPRPLAPDLRPRVPARAPGGVARRHRGRLPPLRRAAGRGPARQRPRAGHAPRRADPRGGVQRAAARLRALLGRAAGRLRTLPGADQGQGRARGRLRQAQRPGRRGVRELGGAGGASRLVDARGRRRPRPRHDGRAADRALRARRGGGPAADRRPAAVPAGARPLPPGAVGLRRRGRHQRLQRALAADRRACSGDRRGRLGPRLPRRPTRSRRTRKPLAGINGSSEPAHFQGVPGFRRPVGEPGPAPAPMPGAEPELLRPLAEYEHAIGGGW